ncbi:MAG: adenylosuccinate synthase [Thermodesulfobacteriota bacterium]
MPNFAVVGTQWGDEGKGRVVDLIAEKTDLIVRFQGGNNAGHTIITDKGKFVLHHIPSGILREGKTSVIANGVAVDPAILLEEIDSLTSEGCSVSPENLKLSGRAHVIMPYHRAIDSLREGGAAGAKIGTTKRGIGPVYEDKFARRGIRVADLLDENIFAARLDSVLPERNLYITKVLGGEPVDRDSTVASYTEYGKRLAGFVEDTVVFLADAAARGRSLLFEGAQGALLDIDFGTYPYVTSSSTVSGGVSAGCGMSPGCVDFTVGVVKAYTTRVGEGPFPTEDKGDDGRAMGEKGAEFGATTGRKRRCGWLDAVALRHSVRINGITSLALTKLDVLSGFEKVKICVAYRTGGEETDSFPQDCDALSSCEPVYEELPGWEEDISGAQTVSNLPQAAVDFIERIKTLCGADVSLISVGPSREEAIIIENSLFD